MYPSYRPHLDSSFLCPEGSCTYISLCLLAPRLQYVGFTGNGGPGATGPLTYLSEQPPAPLSTGQYFWLEPKNAFENFQEPDIGLIALAFLQGSFAYGGWNFLNYVTEELVDPYK